MSLHILQKIAFFLVCIFLMQPFSLASAQDLEFSPRVYGSFEYNDNVEEKRNGRGDAIITVKPGLGLKYAHSRIAFDLSYDFEFKKYMNSVKSAEKTHSLSTRLDVECLKDTFFLTIRDQYSQVYKDVSRGKLQRGETDVETTDLNSFEINPYFSFSLQRRTKMTVSGLFNALSYSDKGSVDKHIYSVAVDIDHELSKNLLARFGARYQKQIPTFQEGGFSRYNALVGLVYNYAEGSNFEVRLEPTYTDFVSANSIDNEHFPYFVGLTHAFSKTLSGKISSTMSFSEDPSSAETQDSFTHSFGFEKNYGRGVIEALVSYRDFKSEKQTSRTQYWRPEIKGKHSLSDRIALTYDVIVDMYTQPKNEGYFFTRLNLRYSFSEESTASVFYRFKQHNRRGRNFDYASNTIGLSLDWKY